MTAAQMEVKGVCRDCVRGDDGEVMARDLGMMGGDLLWIGVGD